MFRQLCSQHVSVWTIQFLIVIVLKITVSSQLNFVTQKLKPVSMYIASFEDFAFPNRPIHNFKICPHKMHWAVSASLCMTS